MIRRRTRRPTSRRCSRSTPRPARSGGLRADLPGKIFAPVSAVPGVAFVGTDRGTLAALDTTTGKELWSYRAPDKTACGPSIVERPRVVGLRVHPLRGAGAGRRHQLHGRRVNGAASSARRRRRGAWLLVAVLVAYAAACSSGDDATTEPASKPVTATTASAGSAGHATGPSTGCDATTTVAPGTTDQHIVSDGVERTYQLDVPASYDGTRPYAIVLGLHALTVDYRFVPSMVGFADVSTKYDFIGVAPSGRPERHHAVLERSARRGQLRRRLHRPAARPPRVDDVHRHRARVLDGHVERRPDVVAPRLPPAADASPRSRRSRARSTSNRAAAARCPSSRSTAPRIRSSSTTVAV